MTTPARPSVMTLRETQEGEGVTPLELFFDLVYVFAFTQVTGLMAQGTAPTSLLDGFIVLALLWWTWCSYAWLANHVRADRGIMRHVLLAATATMFVACLAIPEAFHSRSDGVLAPTVLVICYAVVRLLHITIYLHAAGPDAALRRQVLVSLGLSVAPAVALLSVGVALGENGRRAIWLLAVVIDLIVVFVTSRGGGGWVVRSAAHFAERHGLVVILALGESMVAIAVGVAARPLSGVIVLGAVLAVAIVAGMWNAYFSIVAPYLEAGLAARTGPARAQLGRDVFTYLHLPIVGGVILTALGVEQALAHLGDGHIGVTGAYALGAGVAIHLAASEAAVHRATGILLPARLILAGLLLVLAAFGDGLDPVLALALVALGLLALAVAERSRASVEHAPDVDGIETVD